MASQKQRPRADFRQSLLIVYVGICVIAVVLTVTIAFTEASGSGQVTQPTPTITRTPLPLILTQQAEDAMNKTARPTSGREIEAAATATATRDH